ncbi:MAG: outer membrane lipoprotein-sorting protein [Pseudodesulfovibrio sp.]|uniref:outer membrane lipoprotein-sorting protein n=1 Tax=Pseudodesulfovibrio sp. TaxID=2035812 RepID=UPI003D14D62E
MKKSILILMTVLVGLASSAFAMDADEILEKVDRNLNPTSYESYRKLINIEPDGNKREYTLYTIKKGEDKVASVFLEPSSDKGRATLRLGENMWLHIPSVGKPLRITSLQSVTGGIFNNADIMRLDFSTEYKAEQMEELSDAFVLKLKAKTDEVAYDRLEMTVDKKHLVPTEVKCIAASGMLIKTLHFKKIMEFEGGRVRPAVMETVSPLNPGYKSVMIFAKVRSRDFDDEVFTLNYMPRIESLRK